MKAITYLSLLVAITLCSVSYGQESIKKNNITVIYPPRLRTQAETALKLYMLAAERVAGKINLPAPDRVTIELVNSESSYKKAYARIKPGPAPEHALAVAFSPQNIILLRTSYINSIGSGSLPETLIHETFHLYLGVVITKNKKAFPLWFNEGVAQWVAQQKTDSKLINKLQADARGNRLRSFNSYNNNFPDKPPHNALAYAQSLLFIQWLEKREPGTVNKIISAILEGQPFNVALLDASGRRLSNLEAEFFSQLASQHSFLKSFFSQLTLFSILSLLALAVFIRYLLKRKKLLEKMEEEDSLDGYMD